MTFEEIKESEEDEPCVVEEITDESEAKVEAEASDSQVTMAS